MESTASSPKIDFTSEYAQAVVDGTIVAGPHVRAACRRHLDDLIKAPERGFFFDYEKANRVVEFSQEVLRLNGGEFEGVPFEPLPWQKFILGSLFGWVDAATGYRRFRMAFIECGKGAGKSPAAAAVGLYGLMADGEPRAEVYAAAPLALDTPVPTIDGWKCQGDLVVGDMVFDEKGNPCKVTYLSPVITDKECFEVEFDDGTVIVSNAGHKWLTLDTRGQSPKFCEKKTKSDLFTRKVVTTLEIKNTLRSLATGRLRHRIDLAGSLNIPETALPINPYVLGVWLGDGRSNRGSICYHKDDLQHIDKILEAGYKISQQKGQNNTRYCTIVGLRTKLRELNLLKNKHVPDNYLRASKQQRLELLAGLMDTDGACSKAGECKFTNRNEKLCCAVHDLANGLGVRASVRQITVNAKPHFVVSFKAPKSLRIFNLDRKFNRQVAKVDTRAKARYIRDVRPCKSVPVRCIEVDSKSHLYLVSKSYIATHNTKKDQAMILFRDAVAMATLSPALSSRLIKSGRGEQVWNLAYPETASFFRPISSDKSQSGPRPHIVLLDEIHEHRNDTVVEMMRAGTKGRRQALIFMITNSGFDKQSVCWKYHDYGVKVAAGMLEDDSFFSYICGLDETDNPFDDETCWIKANPSLGVTIKYQYLQEQITQAKGMPSKESVVRRLNFCEWVGADSPWISADIWLHNKADHTVQSLHGRRCYGGLDLSSTQDLTALVLLFEPDFDDPYWRIFPYFWLPADGLEEKAKRDGADYPAWVRQGWLETTPGAAIDHLFVLHRIAEIMQEFDLATIGNDRYRVEYLKNMAVNEGLDLPLVEFGQGYISMAPAVDEFERRLVGRQLKHNGNPVMNWCAANAVVISDPAGNRKPAKNKSTGRIDGIVAAVMAVGQTLNYETEEAGILDLWA